jgi:hypothetical protein
LQTQMKTRECIQNTHKTVGRKCNLSVLILEVCIREVDANKTKQNMVTLMSIANSCYVMFAMGICALI